MALAESTRDDDLLTLRLVHRGIRRDAARLAGLADGLATGTERFSERRALAFGEWVERLCEQVTTYHGIERELLWPLAERHGGAAVDLSGLRDDHEAIEPVVVEVRRGARIVVASLMVRPAAVATVADFARMRGLAASLASLSELLDEHLDDSAREMHPILTTYVPRAEWCHYQELCRRRYAAGGLMLPWLVATARPEELSALRATFGRATAMALSVRVAGLRRSERAVFSSPDPVG